ncbi:ATP-binding protein [Candidatus Bipolaricaulota bacterium]|nr:ATP-binding protein [Candidatus Bipolaricaulota bacterium]
MIPRNVTSAILEALSDTPVVLLNGARQTGKSTLAQWLAEKAHPARYITLDDAAVLAAARDDPTGFLTGLDSPIVLDEVQRAPELFLAIKAVVDRNRVPGHFLLTGSANPLLLPKLSESLAGRMEILSLWPFSQGELEGRPEDFIDRAFASKLPQFPASDLSRSELVKRVLTGGYPEVVGKASTSRRSAWFRSYVTTIVQREVRDLANIEHLTMMPRLLSLLAARAGSLMNYTEISNSLGLPQSTLKRYMALFEMTFLSQPLPAWSTNIGKRLIRSRKVVLNDTGLLAHLIGLNEERIRADPNTFGPLLENFVIMELRKQATWSKTQPQFFHFRTRKGQEVDIVLENAAGEIVGIEVKASSTVKSSDFKGLNYLSELLGDRFLRGIVLYTGDQPVPFGSNLYALPVSTLWESGEVLRG